MTPSARLRAVADRLDNHVVSETQADLIELICLHIERLDASPGAQREARLLMRLLDREGRKSGGNRDYPDGNNYCQNSGT